MPSGRRRGTTAGRARSRVPYNTSTRRTHGSRQHDNQQDNQLPNSLWGPRVPEPLAIPTPPSNQPSGTQDHLGSLVRSAVNEATAPLLKQIAELRSAVDSKQPQGGTKHLHLQLDASTRQNIKEGKFIELRSLLPKQDPTKVELANVSYSCDESGRLVPTTTAKKGKIPLTIEQWTTAFMILMSAMVDDKKDDPSAAVNLIQDMTAYCDLIRSTALELGQEEWTDFDENFRKLMVSDKTTSWAQINSTMWLRSFSKKAKSEATVSKSDKANNPASGGDQPKQSFRPCRFFNSPRGCYMQACSYHHVCSICKKSAHTKGNCPDRFCTICRSTSHTRFSCPDKPERAPVPRPGGNGSQFRPPTRGGGQPFGIATSAPRQ